MSTAHRESPGRGAPGRARAHPALGWLGFAWGLAGVALLLGTAVARLTGPAFATFEQDLDVGHWLAAAISVGVMVYSEGYRGFYKAFSPRVVARARSLVEAPTVIRVLLAPAFCMGYFAATRSRMITSWSLTAMIVLLVVVVRTVPQPWRGIIDLGVVAGLGLGLVSVLWFGAWAAWGAPQRVPLDLPLV